MPSRLITYLTQTRIIMDAKIFIAGSGGIGQAAGLILSESNEVNAEIYLGDISQGAIDRAIKFVSEGCGHLSKLHGVLMPMSESNEAIENALAECDVILDCLPGSQAPRMARLAIKHGCHYANLTEYVAETNEIMELAKDADTGFILQTGLAPGFINVLANQLFQDFQEIHGVDKVDHISMKVGALSAHAQAPHYYAFTWSPIGVATEYMKDAVVVKDYTTQSIPALSGNETIIIDNVTYEDNFTSGGAADLPEAFEGRVRDLDYKTLRYPGHYQWVKETIEGISGDDKIKVLEKTMLDQIPSVEEDVVIVYSSVRGKDSNGVLRMMEKSYTVKPSKVGDKMLRAIQSTTAGPLCEAAYMLLKGGLKGVVLQSQIPAREFLNGPFVQGIYGGY